MFILLASCSPLPGSRPSPSPALLPCTPEQRNKSRWSPDVGDSGICGPFEQEDNTPCSGAASPPWRAPVTPAWVSRGGPTTKLTPHWDGLLRWVAYSIGVQELLCVLEWSAVMVLLPSGKGCTRILWGSWAASVGPGGCGCRGHPPVGAGFRLCVDGVRVSVVTLSHLCLLPRGCAGVSSHLPPSPSFVDIFIAWSSFFLSERWLFFSMDIWTLRWLHRL